jgi:hypothetical protein
MPKEFERGGPNRLLNLAPASSAGVNAVTESHRFSRFIIGVGVTLLACAPALPQASPDYELQKQWETPFDIFGTGLRSRPALLLALFRSWVLCPDGSLYSLVDKQGGIKRTSADGKTDPENVGAIGTPASLLTCDQKDQLYVSSNKNLDVYSLNAQGKLIRSVSAREKFFVQAAVVTPDGNLYVLTEDGSAPVIRQLSADGRVLHKFPAGPQAVSLSPLIFPYPVSHGNFPQRTFDWNEAQQRFVVSLSGFSGFESMDLEGHWKREQNVGSTGYGGPAPVALDRMFVWKGQYIAEVTLKSEIAEVFNVTKLEVLDQSFRTVWSSAITAQDGLLVGVAADGSLYFLRTSNGTDCKLARYTLTRVGQAAN